MSSPVRPVRLVSEPSGHADSTRLRPAPRMILVIDDDRSVTASLSLLLKQAGYSSRAAASPYEALDVLGAEPCHLVIQDMNFSRRTTGDEGLALLGAIKTAHPQLPVILITAWGSIP